MRDLALARRVLLGGLAKLCIGGPTLACHVYATIMAVPVPPRASMPVRESPLVLVNVRNNTHGEVVGRIFKANITPRDRPWFWAITVPAREHRTRRGYAATREDADLLPCFWTGLCWKIPV